ncbi:FG-GAP repeat domain-containing protein [Ramlibacter sp.]|uniref:FG-GAP repeat domain-containing protein n=1 Tax=Ramlibacter sp. TaxID=1917967 RepID=UPI003D0A2879
MSTAQGDREIYLRLPDDRVFEDRRPRLADLDGDGRDEVIVVEAHADRGAALVVFGVEGPETSPRLVERARSPHVGNMRWLNPIGAADFDGDGNLDLVSVTTPHIGGILTLYRYQPPKLVAFGETRDVSNHRMGAVEQRLGAIVALSGSAHMLIVPDQSRRSLRLLRWQKDGSWHSVAPNLPLAAAAERLVADPGGACLNLEDGSWLRLTLR